MLSCDVLPPGEKGEGGWLSSGESRSLGMNFMVDSRWLV